MRLKLSKWQHNTSNLWAIKWTRVIRTQITSSKIITKLFTHCHVCHIVSERVCEQTFWVREYGIWKMWLWYLSMVHHNKCTLFSHTHINNATLTDNNPSHWWTEFLITFVCFRTFFSDIFARSFTIHSSYSVHRPSSLLYETVVLCRPFSAFLARYCSSLPTCVSLSRWCNLFREFLHFWLLTNSWSHYSLQPYSPSAHEKGGTCVFHCKQPKRSEIFSSVWASFPSFVSVLRGNIFLFYLFFYIFHFKNIPGRYI